MNDIKERRSRYSKKETDSYKVKYENEVFEFGFGKFNSDENELKIHTEFNLELEDFKVYFTAMLKAIFEYDEKTGKNFIEELSSKDD